MSETLSELESDPLDGAEILDELRGLITQYVVMPSPEAADAVTLFIAATHAQPAWEHAGRLVIKSPVKRCGKTRLQEVCRETVHRALPTTNISPAALARSLDDDDPPTLILDEADAVWGRRDQRAEGAEDLRGILNSGHSRGWPYVRWDVQGRRAEECNTFAMAVLGGIGDLPDTIEDRAVVVAMRRRAPGEEVRSWRTRRAVPQLRAVRERLRAWVIDRQGSLAEAEPELPAEDRAADVWEPLVAIADAAGADWPKRARAACRALSGAESAEDSGERLLMDIKTVFDTAHFLYSATIVARLSALEDAPWAEHTPRGESITPRALASLLRPYGVRPRDGREIAGPQRKGYYADDLADPWNRYTPQAYRRDNRDNRDIEDPHMSLPAETPVADAGSLSATHPRHDQRVADAEHHPRHIRDTQNPRSEHMSISNVADVADVADPRARPAEKGQTL